MAENTKTYTAKIEVETGDAVKELKVLEGQVQTAVGDFENVTEAISKLEDRLRTLDPGTKQFKELSKQLQTLRDRQRDADISSRRFTEALAEQPGVIGLVGGSLEGLRNTIRIFAANPLIAVLAGITGGLLALRESLTRTEEGQEKLNRISKLFKGILDGLFAIIEPFAFALADLATNLLENEKFMSALGKAAGILYAVLVPLGNFVGNQLITAFRALVDVAGGAGKVLKGVFTFDLDLIKDGLSQAKDAVVTGITETVTNAKELGVSLWENFASGIEEGSSIFRQRAEDSITDYANWIKTQREQLAKDRLETEKQFGETLLSIDEDVANMSLEIEKDNQKRSEEFQKEATDKKIESINSELESAKAASEARADVETMALDAVSYLAGQNAKSAKALAIVQALINTFQGATKALAQGGIFGVGSAAAIVAAGLVQVNNIRKQKVPETPRPSGGMGRISGGTAPAAPSIPTIVPPQIQTPDTGGNVGEQIAETIRGTRQQPVKAFVVGSDITSQQQLDRRTNVAATF